MSAGPDFVVLTGFLGSGKTTLLRDFLDRTPDTHLPLAEVDWPPLGHKPSKERYKVIKPIKPFKLPDEIEQRDMIYSWD